MKNILVTGTGEFIGGHLVKRLIKDGFQLVAKVLSSYKFYYMQSFYLSP